MKSENCTKCLQTKSYIRKGLCKGCYFKENPDKYKEHKNRVKQYAKTLNGKFLNAKSQAKERGIDFCLSKEQYEDIVSKSCEYCSGKLPEKGTGLDRIDCNVGYIYSNVVPCCTACNSIKGLYLTHKEMKLAMKAVLDFRVSI